jgi:hypothetical protein
MLSRIREVDAELAAIGIEFVAPDDDGGAAPEAP